MSANEQVLTHVTYVPKKGMENQLLDLVKRHWPALKKAGLATAEPAQIYRAQDKHTQKLYFIEIFAWKDAKSSELAHQMPEVMAIWEPMGKVMESARGPESIAQLERIPL
jgi:hypothetical protein